ncbi:MAG: methyl-accepting chemotaxis protein [Myxococcaceae bacterium]
MTSASHVREVVASALRGTADDIRRADALVEDGMVALASAFDVFRSQLALQQRELSSVVELLQGEDTQTGFVERMNRIVSRFVEDLVTVSAASMRMMGRVEEMGPDIEAIVVNIRRVESMARKTRFVALNATIHSARTGPSGRTFRVVADQVKALAEDAAVVSAHVRDLVTNVSTRLTQLRTGMSTLASHDMNGAVEGQQKVVELLCTLDATNKRVSAVLAEVERAATETIAAFELRTEVTKALADASARLAPLLSLWDEWAKGQPDTLPPGVEAMFAQLEPALTKASAVKQDSLDAGTVELF